MKSASKLAPPNSLVLLKASGPAGVPDSFGSSVIAATAAALHPGNNTIAVTCHQTTGGQGIDVGILVQQKPKAQANGKTY